MPARKAAEDSPQNAESFFPKTRMPQKGTCPRAKPPKTAPKMPKAFFRKQECLKKGHAHAANRPFGTDPQQTVFNGAHSLLPYMLS
jgi:hypothetical protein